MSKNLGRSVKWIGEDGGWKTGRVVLLPDFLNNGHGSRYDCKVSIETASIILVKENHDGELTWVRKDLLLPWPDVEYCSRCCKEKDKCECVKSNKEVMKEDVESIPPPKRTITNTLVCMAGKSVFICDEVAKGIHFPVQGYTNYSSRRFPSGEEVVRKFYGPIPQHKVTRDELLKAALEQIKEEEEGLLSPNKALQEAYEE